MEENRNFMLALALSIGVLVLWQYFFAMPEAERLRQQQLARQAAQKQTEQTVQTPGKPAAPGSILTPRPGAQAAQPLTREAALKEAGRITIDTGSIKGSISLKGARFDDVVLKQFRVTVKPDSDNVILLSPLGGPDPYYAEYGWLPSNGASIKVPDADTVWTADTPGPLTPSNPVKLSWDNGQGLIFRQTISIDDNYMFTITQSVENKSGQPVTLNPYAVVTRQQKPKTDGYYLQHEGLVGVFGDDGKHEAKYDDVAKAPSNFSASSGWLGFMDKYWAAVVIPDQKLHYQAQFSGPGVNGQPGYSAIYLLDPVTVGKDATQSVTGRLFAGAKQVNLIDAYEANLGIKKFELLIDWGWFHFITKPLFYVLDFFYKLVGNFGISILIVTVLVKLVFFPLANKSYASMSKLKKLQPEMNRIRERYKDDKMRQQQEMMALYKKEKVNPLSGCLPILIQIPVFFALYKVLFITIEMRHAPFFGWIQDLSAPDPTTIFNLFGLIPWDPGSVPVLGHYLMLGVWPLLMGLTMWVQMKLTPATADPVQAQVLTWMPVIFTFMLASFPAGLVIYWTWNNLLSIIQQCVIMHRQGVKIELLDNMGLAKFFGGAAPQPAPAKQPARSDDGGGSKSGYRGKRV